MLGGEQGLAPARGRRRNACSGKNRRWVDGNGGARVWVTLNFVSGCLWAFGLRGNVFDWVERVTLFGDELPPFDKLLGLFSIFRLPILWAAFFVRAC